MEGWSLPKSSYRHLPRCKQSRQTHDARASLVQQQPFFCFLILFSFGRFVFCTIICGQIRGQFLRCRRGQGNTGCAHVGEHPAGSWERDVHAEGGPKSSVSRREVSSKRTVTGVTRRRNLCLYREICKIFHSSGCHQEPEFSPKEVANVIFMLPLSRNKDWWALSGKVWVF